MEEHPPYEALAVANWFLDIGVDLDPMKLQKLVYFAHGWHLGICGEPLIDEEIQAWAYGPVVPSLYHEFKEFGSGPIKSKARRVALEGSKLRIYEPTIPQGDNATRALLERIWELYGHKSGVELSAMTHLPDSPWTQVRRQKGNIKFAGIGNEVMKNYFADLAKRSAHA